MGTVFDAILGKQGLNILIGGTPEADAAEMFALTRDMRPGASSTLGKAMRVRLVANGEKARPGEKAKKRAHLRQLAMTRMLAARREIEPLRPRIVRVIGKATFRNAAGETRELPYLHTVDRSRYTPEKLRLLRRKRR